MRQFVKSLFIVIILFSPLLTGATTKKEFIVKHKTSGSKMSKKVLILTNTDKKVLEKEAIFHKIKNSYSFIITRDASGNLLEAFCFINVMHIKFPEYHNVGVLIKTNGIIKAVELIGPHGTYGSMLQTKSFQEQFSQNSSKKMIFGKDINGVTGATESAEVVVEVVNIVRSLFLNKISK